MHTSRDDAGQLTSSMINAAHLACKPNGDRGGPMKRYALSEGLRLEESVSRKPLSGRFQLETRIGREMGKGGEVILEQRLETPCQEGEETRSWMVADHGIEGLAQKLVDLDRRIRELTQTEKPGVASEQLLITKWNLKAARRRLRRLLKDLDLRI